MSVVAKVVELTAFGVSVFHCNQSLYFRVVWRKEWATNQRFWGSIPLSDYGVVYSLIQAVVLFTDDVGASVVQW